MWFIGLILHQINGFDLLCNFLWNLRENHKIIDMNTHLLIMLASLAKPNPNIIIKMGMYKYKQAYSIWKMGIYISDTTPLQVSIFRIYSPFIDYR